MNIVWKNANGDIRITTLLDATINPQEYATEIADQNQGYSAVAFNCAVPEDRLWRAAFTHDEDKGIHVDIEKARWVFRQFLRQARMPKLNALDVVYMQALEKSDTNKLNEISTAKQYLRDLPDNPSIDVAVTLEQLLLCWPAEFEPLAGA